MGLERLVATPGRHISLIICFLGRLRAQDRYLAAQKAKGKLGPPPGPQSPAVTPHFVLNSHTCGATTARRGRASRGWLRTGWGWENLTMAAVLGRFRASQASC